MPISAKVSAHSISPCGAELWTLICTYPRPIHSELLTHRVFSRSAASSRAIPINKMLGRIKEDPFVPLVWGANKPGMQAGDELQGDDRREARRIWLSARDQAVRHASQLKELGLHKQIVNRVTEPWMWITIIISGTSYLNLDGLRVHPDAEPHFFELAKKMKAAREESTPRALSHGEWHMPLIDWDDEVDKKIPVEDLRKISVARCARISYLTHEGKRDPSADMDLYNKLIVQNPAHSAPSEHVAQALGWPKWYEDTFEGAWSDNPPWATVYDLQGRVVGARRERAKTGAAPSLADMQAEAALGELQSGNFLGFRQFRKTLANEHIGGLMP